MSFTRPTNPRMSSRKTTSNLRRGNTIVLVAGILVLLVIIATAYVTRTGGERITAKVQQDAGLRDDTHQAIAEMLADEIAMSLFVRPLVENNAALAVPPTPPINPWTNGLWTSDTPHLYPPPIDANRYERDVNFPWNAPPYHVVPWTNPPDVGPGASANVISRLPKGPGNVNGGSFSALLNGEGNPFGGPGFGDCRWLRDIEPLRWYSDYSPSLFPLSKGPEAFSHYRHLTNISRPENGWRIVTDISNMFPDLTFDDPQKAGWLVTNLQIPVEQWLTAMPLEIDLAQGNPSGTTRATNHFIPMWKNWFGGPTQSLEKYLDTYVHAPTGGNMIPGNLYKLNDLDSRDADGDGQFEHDWFVGGVAQDRPESEFIRGTARWMVSRVLADSDGDGFTDSFWWLAPTPVENGIRQIVAVSIIDNQGLLNANVATNYVRNGTDDKTLGTLPTDIALVGERDTLNHLAASNYNVGFFDSPDHDWWPPAVYLGLPGDQEFFNMFDYNPGRWEQHAHELNLPRPGNPVGADWVMDQDERLDYWLKCASSPLSVDPTTSYTPYSLADEIELRMYAGQNYGSVYSRFEASVQAENLVDQNANVRQRFLRAGRSHAENTEYGLVGNSFGQLSNRQLVADQRHRLTLYNNVRNDILPQWLWLDQKKSQNKLDLRRLNFGISNLMLSDYGYTPDNSGRRAFLRDMIMQALTDPIDPLVTNRFSYYGTGDDAIQRTRDLASAFMANLMQWRDDDNDSPLGDTIPVVNANGDTMPSRYMGMEPQPFIVEAFIGHIYKSVEVEPGFYDSNNNGIYDSGIDFEYSNAGHNIVIENEERRSTVVVVQIANPYNKTFNLMTEGYQLTVMGQTIRLPGLLRPGTPENPSTHIFYAIRDNFAVDAPDFGAHPDLKKRWCDFLDIPDDLAGVTVADCEQPAQTFYTNVRPGTPIGITPGVPAVVGGGGGPTGGGPGGGDPPPPGDPPPTGGGPPGGPPAGDAEPWDVTSRAAYDTGPALNALVLSRLETDTGPVIVIDRIDHPSDPIFGNAVRRMGESQYKPVAIADLPGDYAINFDGEPYGGANGDGAAEFDLGEADPNVAGGGHSHWVQWVRATRAWGADLDGNGAYDQNERNPRYVFGDYKVIESGSTESEQRTTNWVKSGNKYIHLKDGDDDAGNPTQAHWFARSYKKMDGNVVLHQPTFFNQKGARAATGPAFMPDYPDKGWYSQEDDVVTGLNPPTPRLNFPFQMLQKNDDFEQLGEIYNVFLYGHRIRAPEVNGEVTYQATEVTFSEALSARDQFVELVGEGVRVNRMRATPADTIPPIAAIPAAADVSAGFLLGVGSTDPRDPRHAIPDMPAAARLMDLFVCDGPGVEGVAGFEDFKLAGGFQGKGTPGMININTAPPEVMQALPNWYRLVHETGGPNDSPALNLGNEYKTPADQKLVSAGGVVDAILPRVMLPEAVWSYRERFNSLPISDANPTGIPGGPGSYENRGKLLPGDPATQQLRGDRGIASIGELFCLNSPALQHLTRETVPGDATQPKDEIYRQFWKIDMGVTPSTGTANANQPFKDALGEQVSLRLTTDLVGEYDHLAPNTPRADRVAGDVEEANMLFNGVSNLITTRSDTFTVYFRVRSFRQNTTANPPVWDATNPDYIIDDSRYVMLVDRSNVNHPSDKPKILYFEKLPN